MSATVQEEVTYSKRNRRKQLQFFFNYLTHAKKCQREKKKDPISDSYKTNLCKFELCMHVDLVVNHKILLECRSMEYCNFNMVGCSSSSKILSHCKLCKDSNCFICPLLKRKNFTSEELHVNWIDSVFELRNYFGNLDLLCMLDDKDEIYHCSCGQPMTPGFLNYMDCNNHGLKRLHLPGGLIIEDKKAVTSGTKTWHSSITPEQRSSHISGFFRTIFKEADKIATIDKTSFYFLAFAATTEKHIYESSDSKSEYIKSILETIKEIDEEFRNYRQKEEKLTVQNAVQKFFKGKIANDGLTKAELPNGLTYILGKPKRVMEKDEKLWRDTLNLDDRQELISTMYMERIGDSIFIKTKALDNLLKLMYLETTMYNESKSKEQYIINIWVLKRGKLSDDMGRSNKWLSRLVDSYGLSFNESVKKISKPRNRTYNKQSQLDKLKNVTGKLSNPNYADSNVGESDRPAFCFLHYLLLTYSVAYQLWTIQ